MGKTNTISPLRQRMIEDMTARNLGHHSQRSHIYSCKLFAAFLKRSPDTANADDVRRFQLHLMESGHSIINRNRIMTAMVLWALDMATATWRVSSPNSGLATSAIETSGVNTPPPKRRWLRITA